MKKKFLSLLLAAPLILGAISLNNNKQSSPVKAAQPYPDVELNTQMAPCGYYKGDYKVPEPYVNDFGMFYIGDDDFKNDIITYEVTGEKEITFHAPYVFPQVLSTLPGYNKRGFYRNYESKVGSIQTHDAWSGINTVEYQLNVDASNFVIKGTLVESYDTPSKIEGMTYTGIQRDGTRFPLQNFKLTFPNKIEDYTYLSIDLGYLSYLSLVDIEKSGEDYPVQKFTHTLVEQDFLLFELKPTSFVFLGGGSGRAETQSSWSEVNFGEEGDKSFLTHERAKSTLSSLIRSNSKAINNAVYMDGSGFSFDDPINLTDHRGKEYAIEEAFPEDESEFRSGQAYNIVVFPDYDNTSLYGGASIGKAFKKDDPAIETYIETHTEDFIKDCNVFDDYGPAEAYPGNEALIEKNIILENGLQISYEELATIKKLEFPNNDFQEVKINGIYYIEDGGVAYLPSRITFGKGYDYELVANPTMTNTSWKKAMTPSGSDTFKNIWNQLFTAKTDEGTALKYIKENDQEINKVVVSSNDKTFIRITKDNLDPVEYEASTTFEYTKNGSISIKKKDNVELDFSEPGEYKIELHPRAGSTITRSFTVYGSDCLMPKVTLANNFNLEFSVNTPGKENLKELKIFRSNNKPQAFEGSSYLIETNVEDKSKDSEFELILKDDKNIPISTQNLDYFFKNYNNPFDYCYYIQISCLNVTKAYYLYWHYSKPVADIIDVKIADWPSNINWSTTYEVLYYSSSGEEPSEESKIYDVIQSDPTIVNIDKENKKITANKVGTTKLTFFNKYKAEFIIELTITDDEEFKRRIEASSTYVSVYKNEGVDFEAHALPEGYMDDSQLVYQMKDSSIAKFENGKIIGLKVGETVLNISYYGDESLKLSVTIVVSERGSSSSSEPPSSSSVPPSSSSEGPSSSSSQGSSGSSIEPDPTPIPDDGNNTNAIIVLSVVGGVGAIAIGIFIFLIIRAKKTGNLKK